MKLEEKLVQLRKDKGLSQMYVANVLDVSRQAISRWEVGTVMPSTDNLRKLAELYEVNVDALLKESVVIQPMQANDQRTEAELPSEKHTTEHMLRKSGIKVVGYVAASAILALLIFLAGYKLGHAKVEQTQNAPIPMNEMETMDLDLSDAAIGTYGWPDFGEGGE
ncbi:MAG: helix-turn-helix transcriptional regulator [Oscillospiraceae bacterium]|nr:helix-turn-helix transcriptional regulator [Oscillospiraceae bacterium]